MATLCYGFSVSINTTHMTSISIDTSSLSAFSDRMKKRSVEVKNATEVILKKAVFIVERFGKYYSPVDTGRMRASIGGGSFAGGSFGAGEGINFSRIGENIASIGPTVTYAKYVHARVPFMSTAAIDSLSEIERVALSEIKKAIK